MLLAALALAATAAACDLASLADLEELRAMLDAECPLPPAPVQRCVPACRDALGVLDECTAELRELADRAPGLRAQLRALRADWEAAGVYCAAQESRATCRPAACDDDDDDDDAPELECLACRAGAVCGQDHPAPPGRRAVGLMGGGADEDAAFLRWLEGLEGAGDVLVVRTSGGAGYNKYLCELGVADTVTTVVAGRVGASESRVLDAVARADAIFIPGGNQAQYLCAWCGTAFEAALRTRVEREGIAVGGTSAGMVVLGGTIFEASRGTVFADEALADPYNPFMTMGYVPMLRLGHLANVATETHFYERDRMGRLVAFVSRTAVDKLAAPRARAIAADERTAIVLKGDGTGTVVGQGFVYAAEALRYPEACAPGEALVVDNVAIARLGNGATFDLLEWRPLRGDNVAEYTVATRGGELIGDGSIYR